MTVFRFGKKIASRADVIWCYRTLLGRDPESEALIQSLAKSKSLHEFIETFITSGECREKGTETLTSDDVTWCYRTLLGREPESEAAIQSHSKSGSLRKLVEAFINSQEFCENDRKPLTREDVIWAYRTLLRRDPESEAAIATHLRARNLRGLVDAIARTREFFALTEAAGTASSRDDVPGSLIPPTENANLAMAEYRAGVSVVRSTPALMTLETSSRCNLRCVMCPQSINAVDRPRHLDEEVVIKLERFIRQTTQLQLHGIGEPLASPSFWKSLKLVPDACDKDISINTNLTVLDDKRLDELLASPVKLVNVSLDAACPETYRKIRGFSFDEVIGNIRRLVAGRRAVGKSTPHLWLNMTLMRSNIEEVLEFIELAASLDADAVCLWHLNRMPDPEMERWILERDGWSFDYSKEGLWNFPELSNEYIRKAVALARERGVRLNLDHNKVLYFDEGEKQVDRDS